MLPASIPLHLAIGDALEAIIQQMIETNTILAKMYQANLILCRNSAYCVDELRTLNSAIGRCEDFLRPPF